MSDVIPVPSLDNFPKVYRDNPDTGVLALSAKIDTLVTRWNLKIGDMMFLESPDRCPAQFVRELGELVSAGIYQEDTETQAREKVSRAIASHKVRGSWLYNAKLVIDIITGYSSSIYEKLGNSGQWVWYVDSGRLDRSYKWAIFDGGNATSFGLTFIGGYDEVELAGLVYIDLGSSTIPYATIEQIKRNLSDVVPAYFIIKLGYTTGTVFTTYPNGVIS